LFPDSKFLVSRQRGLFFSIAKSLYSVIESKLQLLGQPEEGKRPYYLANFVLFLLIQGAGPRITELDL